MARYENEHCSIPGIMLRGEEIGEILHKEIEEIQALYYLCGNKRSKSSVIVELATRGVKPLKESLKRLAREKGKI